jgi:hypothetical protein
VAAVLFGILAVSNALKPLEIGAQTGLVFFGQRLSGTPNLILGPVFGIFLAAYAAGIWRMRRYALPLAWIYAAYVLVNLALFSVRTPQPAHPSTAEKVFGIVYAIVALGCSFGTAWVLQRRARELD